MAIAGNRGATPPGPQASWQGLSAPPGVIAQAVPTTHPFRANVHSWGLKTGTERVTVAKRWPTAERHADLIRTALFEVAPAGMTLTRLMGARELSR